MHQASYAAGFDRRGATFGRCLPQFRPYPFRWGAATLDQLELLTKSGRYRFRLGVFPAYGDRLFDAGESKEDQLSLTAGSFVWGFTGASTQAAGYRVMIWDNQSSRQWFAGSVVGSNIAGGPTPALLPGLTLGFPKPAQLVVRVVNMATAAAEIQFCAWVAERIRGAS